MAIPAAASRPAAQDDQSVPLLVLIADVIPDHQRWLDTANAAFGGVTPRSLIGGPDEPRLRELVLAYKYGVFS
jgi:hypothetical protein